MKKSIGAELLRTSVSMEVSALSPGVENPSSSTWFLLRRVSGVDDNWAPSWMKHEEEDSTAGG